MPQGQYPRTPRTYPLPSELGIDDAATVATYGYSATSLPPSSHKSVIVTCDLCRRPFARIRLRLTTPPRCVGCSRAKTPADVDVASLVDVAATRTRFGYDLSTITRYGNDKVVARCVCGGTFDVRMRSLRSDTKCPSCRKTAWHAAARPPREHDGHTLLDDAETLERYGWAASALSPQSTKMVVARCSGCDRLFERVRRNLTDDAQCPYCAQERANREKLRVRLQRFKATMLERHGVENALQSPVIRAQMEVRNVAKYDVANVAQVKKINDRRRGWWVRKHGAAPIENLGVQVEATIKKYDVDPRTLGTGSAQLVVCRCVECSRLFNRVRKHLRAPARCRRCSVRSTPRQHYQIGASRRALTMLARYGTTGAAATTKTYGAAETAVATLIAEWTGAPVVRNKPLDGRKTLDIFVPARMIGVEYCGLFWHHEASPTPRGKEYHQGKLRLANSLGIRLVTIFEDEWLERRQQVENFLRSILCPATQQYGARRCSCDAITPEVAHAFLEQQHVQGARTGTLAAFGLHAEGALLGVVTFGPHHRQGQRALVLTRLCFAPDVHVAGGASRLISRGKAWAREHGYSQIISWSDDRWSEGGVYAATGFKLAAELPPDYSYVSVRNPRERISKQSQMKGKTACPTDKTEHQWALERGLSRIWDCGHKRWVLDL